MLLEIKTTVKFYILSFLHYYMSKYHHTNGGAPLLSLQAEEQVQVRIASIL